MTTSNQKRQPKGRPVGGRYATTEHAEPTVTLADPPAGKRTSKGVVTTVTLPNGVVAKRTSEKGNYTHAVVLPPEDPELVRQVRTARIAQLEQRLAVIDATLAMEKPILRIRNRGFAHGKDADLDHQGKPSYHGFETMLYAADGKTVLEYTHSNSKGVVQGIYDHETGGYDSKATQPARDCLIAKARATRERLAKDLEDDQKALADLEAGTYDFGQPQVARWSSREDLAVKAAQGEFAKYNTTRRPYVVPVDGYDG